MSGEPPQAQKPAAGKSRAYTSYKVRRLPPDVRKELDERLVNGDFTDYRGLSKWLHEKNYEISPAAINYYAHSFEQRLSAVKLATKQAHEIVQATGADDEKMNQALMRLVQTTMFEMMVRMYDARRKFEAADQARARSRIRLAARASRNSNAGEAAAGEGGASPDDAELATKYPTKAEIAAMGSVGRTVAALRKLDLEWEKWRTQMKLKLEQQVDAAKERVTEAVKEGGLSPEAESRIRSALLEIRV